MIDDSPIRRALDILGDRAYTGPRGELVLDGKMVAIIDVIHAANRVLHRHKMPIIHYPTAYPKHERYVA